MRLLIDNDVREDVAKIFERRGFEVVRVRDSVGEDADDATVAAYAHTLRAVVVTQNHKHFRTLISRRPEQKRQHLNAGRISIRCAVMTSPVRVGQLLDLLEFEHKRGASLDDTRFIAEIRDHEILFER